MTMADNFNDPFAQNLVGLWDFLSGGETDDTGLADGIAQGGSTRDDVSFSGGRANFDGKDDVFDVAGDAEVAGNDAPFDLAEGTIAVEFRVDEMDKSTIVSRGEYDDKHDEGFFSITAEDDGKVKVRHYANDEEVKLETSKDFYDKGDDVKVTYTWSETEGGTFLVENLTEGTSESIDFSTTGLTMDIGDNDDESFSFGAREKDDGDYDHFLEGSIAYVAIYDVDIINNPPDLLDGVVDGTDDGELIDVNYDGDPEGDKVDNGDAILPGATPDSDVIDALGGDDTVLAGNEDDTIFAGSGNDSVEGGGGNDVIFGDSNLDDAVNLIENGSFEDTSGLTATGYGFVGNGSLPGWTESNDADIDVHSNGRGNVDATDGSNWLDLSASPSMGVIGQDVSGVVDGQTYALSFDAADGDGLSGGENLVDVFWGGELVARIDPASSDMENYNFAVTGGSGDGSNRLEFANVGGNDNLGASIDNVQLVASDIVAAGDDTLNGGSGDDVIFGEGGQDSIDGGTGGDTLSGGADNDTILGGDGSDSITGDEGDDLIYGDNAAGTPVGVVRESFEWDESGVADGAELGGFTQNTGNVDVTFSVLQQSPDATTVLSDETQLTSGIQDDGGPVDSTSSLDNILFGQGNSADYRLDFADPVQDVSFRINDVDGDGVVRVTAFDANSNPIVVTLEAGNLVTLSDTDGVAGNDTADSNGGYLDDDNPQYSVLVTIPGPVSRIEIEHDQNGADNSGINITDVYFDVPLVDTGVPGDDTIDGGIGEDTIFGEGGDDDISGGDGDDELDGGTGDDTIDGGDDNDTINGGDGSDSILGGEGDDVITAGNPDDDLLVDKGYPGLFTGEEGTPEAENDRDYVDGGAGNDTITTGDDRDTVDGGTGDDVIDGGIDDDVIDGGDGADRIVGGEGSDKIDGGIGNDTIYAGLDPDSGVSDVVNIEDDGSNPLFGADLRPDNGIDTVHGGEGDDVIFGADDADFLYGDEGNDLIFGEIDNDYIEGGDGEDSLSGGQGDDTISGGDDTDIIFGGSGDDSIDGDAGNDLVLGGDGDDTISGGEGIDILDGEDGDDTIDGGANSDLIAGELGDDRLIGGGDADALLGGAGNDTLFGDGVDGEGNTADGGADFLFGGDGDDSLIGGTGNDTLDGADGADFMSGGDDRDTFIEVSAGDTIVGGEGGDDVDTLVVSSTSIVDFDPSDPESGTVTFYDFGSLTPTGTATFSEIENVVFVEELPNPIEPDENDDSDDVGIEDVIVAGGVTDPFTPQGGAGYVDGTSGNDSINLGYTGDPEGDRIDNNDAILPGEGPDDDIVLAGDGDDSVLAGVGDDEVFGGDGRDVLNGQEGNDILRGEGDDDILIGGDGVDQLSGGDGFDILLGGTGSDVLSGGAGNDNLLGDQGNDFLVGGTGNDILTGGSGQDFIVGGTGNDSIDLDDGATGNQIDIAFGGDDADTFVNGGAGDTVIGGEGGNDNDTLDLTGSGPLTINFDGGDPNSESGTVDFLDAGGNVTGTLTFSEIENVIPCFTPGTLIATAQGERRVEELSVGDRVITRDNGIQQVRWVGHREMSGDELAQAEHLRPVLIRQGALGKGLPERDMLVSPQHRVLISNEQTELYFYEAEVLVAAKHLTDMDGIDVVDVSGTTYIHVMFDQHEVILSDGAWTESFQPGDQTMASMGDAQREEILELFPELGTSTGISAYSSARRSLKKHEAKLLTQ
jgi:Ca2+-binding RTX toxin-like protein